MLSKILKEKAYNRIHPVICCTL